MSQVTREEMIAAIYGQESSSGKADTSQENYARARGPMQVTYGTFQALKNKGIIPKNFRHDNPEDTKQAGDRLVGYLFDKYNGDPKKIAAAYYAGEKAVRDDGSIRNYRDLNNPKAPSTHDYVAQVVGRLGAGGDLPTPTSGPVGRASVLASWDEGMPAKLVPVARAVRSIGDSSYAPIAGTDPLTGEGVVPEADRLAAVTKLNQEAQQRAKDTSFLDMSRAASMHQGVSAIVKSLIRPEYTPDPTFTIDPKRMAGMTGAEQEFLGQATNEQHAQRIEWEIQQERDDMATVNVNGTGMGIAASLFAGVPEGYLLGMGAARALQLARVGSLQLAAQGRRGAAAVSGAVENVGANVAMTALQDAFDPYVGSQDYAMALGGGILGWGLNLPTEMRTATTALKKQGQEMADAAAARTLMLREQAVRNLGPDATPEQLQGEVRRLDGNGIRQELAAGSAPVAPNRRLLPEDETLRADAPEAASKDSDVGAVVDAFEFGDSVRPRYNEPSFLARREEMATVNPEWRQRIKTLSDGEFDFEAAKALPAGVHATAAAKADVRLVPALEAVQGLASKFLGKDTRLILGTQSNDPGASGEIISAGKVHFVGVNPRGGPTATVRTAVHEVGHAVFHEHAVNIPTPLLARMQADHAEFLRALKGGAVDEAVNRRFGLTSPSREATPEGLQKAKQYAASFDEYSAEQFVKYVEKQAREGGDVGLTKRVVEMIKDAINAALDFFRSAKRQGFVDPDDSFAEFFQGVLDGNLKQAKQVDEFLDPGLVLPSVFNRTPADVLNDPVARANGLSLLPIGTPQQQAEARAVVALYKKAIEGGYRVDEKRLSKLLDTAMFKGAQSTANIMLRSENPVVRMVAAELLESPSGAGGRRSTAAIAKYMNERAYLGNALNEVQAAYKVYRNQQGGTVADDFFGGQHWEQFNRLVAEEIEARRPGAPQVDSHPAVREAADRLEQAYERMRQAQITTKTVGWGALPETSAGYMPHKMSPEKVRNMTNSQAQALHQALIDQFVQIEGFDLSFSDNLAAKYIDRIRRRALGGFDAPANIHQVGAADIVQEALEQMGMTQPEIVAMMKKYIAGGAGHTKKRLSLNLLSEHQLEDGSSFRLLDLFETDQFRLLRSQANRVSGEVALARHGVMGKAGLSLLRRAMEFGADGQKATADELLAFDQIAAEFLGDSFGTQSKMVDRVMQVNSLARLGGMGFTQFAEAVNGIFHVGAAKSLAAVSDLARLRREIKDLAAGKAVDNPIIGSLEKFGGAEFGTDAYKTVFPFDNQSLQYQTYGKDTLTAGDRLLRGGTFLQGRLSLWRSIHSAQQRGMAEQIVRKAAEYLRDGKNDIALRDMGIGDDLMARLRADLSSIAEFEGNQLTNFDITKATDLQAADEFTQAIHRGVSQIIQGTFIGEQGRWVHDGMMRLMTQFRTFSLTSIEKQWDRQVGNVGVSKALGMMLGAMSVAAPIYMARTYLASVGREDQDEYLSKQLAPAQIARASMNYIALSGLAGDFLDATTAVTGIGTVTGGRTGVGSEFVGNVVAPAAGLVDDVWRGLQNTKEGTDPHELLKTLPMNRLPFMIPAINALD